MPNKHVEEVGQELDPVLKDLADAVQPIAEALETSQDHALFALGVKYMDGDSDSEGGVQTYINACGFFGILEEGLFAELADQVEQGHMGLFLMLRRVVRDIEEEMGISPDDEIEDEEDVPASHYH